LEAVAANSRAIASWGGITVSVFIGNTCTAGTDNVSAELEDIAAGFGAGFEAIVATKLLEGNHRKAQCVGGALIEG